MTSRIEKKCNDYILKYDFVAATPSRRVIFRLSEAAVGYQQILIEEGSLIIQCKKSHWYTNVHEISQYKLELIVPSTTSLPVVIKMSTFQKDLSLILVDIRDQEDKYKKHIHRIREACGKEFVFEVDFRDVLDRVQATQSSAKDRLGEILHDSYLSNIAEM
jgi:hypothetical protein